MASVANGKSKKMTPPIDLSFLNRLLRFFFRHWIPMTARLVIFRLLFAFAAPKRMPKKLFWLYIGAGRAASTTLRANIFQHHPEIYQTRSFSLPLKQLKYLDRATVAWVSQQLYLKNYIGRSVLSRRIRLGRRLKNDRGYYKNIRSFVRPKVSFLDARNKTSFHGNEVMSAHMVDVAGSNLKASPQYFRANTRILYVTRNEETHLQSFWLSYLSIAITIRADNLPYIGADDFAKLARRGAGPDVTTVGHSVRMLMSAFANVYNPKRLLQEAAPRWGAGTVVLPYELLQKDPEAFLGKMSGAMGINADTTISLFKKSMSKKGVLDMGHPLHTEFSDRRNMSMTERGLAFCRAFKHPRAEYNQDRQFFFKTARNYAERLPGPVNKQFLVRLAKIERGWNGNSENAILELVENKPFQDWLRRGEKVKPQFSAKTLAELRKIRAPQNRWMAKEFGLDLEKYGYAM